ncbi:UbiA prenyltransferase family-domain-containing protein [Aspergillus pseudonomiae]|uniref:UbiA prenyltransferase family-domain-containing protein n=1 Tax=Aspergillus pseudonomiae TaxID=1506151 RepID=A0A5N7CZC2_9EURO|nr:UbiA prenyltransferase family-domain-containing protein [Aspergillus pseudonomiae]KAB8254242.1 UbiA prenyltransferase family-domain-containing protein [Aspergillus pseudonomiae]KAE8399157.1 UbiA prenyltransferase family-domain-containing protein [Aspergillus pseudonomiae]
MEKTRQDPSISTKPFPFKDLPAIIWLFSESDIPTFVLPNSAFGLLGALAGPALADGSIFPSAIDLVFYRLPLVILFNWAVVFIFQLANQRSPEAIQEDRLNKPWRPLPTGRISAEQTRRLLLVAIPAVLALTYGLRVWQESALIMILAWMYNDLKGGDELSRDLVIAIAYGLFNASSLRIALGSSADLNPAAAHISRRGYLWITMISGVILTTMSIQDLKDMAGDRSRGRLTIPLLVGPTRSRWLIAALVLCWGPACVFFWGLPLRCYIAPCAMAVGVAASVVWQRDIRSDAAAWRLWCAWLVVLYLLPWVATSGIGAPVYKDPPCT